MFRKRAHVLKKCAIDIKEKTRLDLKLPAKIAVWFLETGRFLPVSIRVSWFLFWF